MQSLCRSATDRMIVEVEFVGVLCVGEVIRKDDFSNL